MGAIAEFAIFGELKNVVEDGDGAGRSVPWGDFTHAGRVNEYAGGGLLGAGVRREKDHWARSGRVAAAIVGFADGLGEERRRASEGAGERVN